MMQHYFSVLLVLKHFEDFIRSENLVTTICDGTHLQAEEDAQVPVWGVFDCVDHVPPPCVSAFRAVQSLRHGALKAHRETIVFSEKLLFFFFK